MTRLTRSLTAIATAAAVLTAVVACSGTSTPAASDAAPTPTASTTSAPGGAITVFGAASLKATFTQLGSDFETANPGTTITFSFAGSSDLVTQITGGAPADVFASADEKNMAKLTDAELVTDAPIDFATNVLEIAVPPGNPANVTSFADLADPSVKTVICAAAVPCGAATATIEKATGVTIPAVSEESAVTDVLGKVSSGEADAGLVYVTDVRGAGSAVDGVTFAESSQAVNTYPIAALAGSSNPALAQAFVAYVSGASGQKVLADAGFGAPPAG